MTPKVSIVIPSYKHLDDCLRPCCESLIRFTDLSSVEVIVVLNGCGDDGSREYVESLGSPFKAIWLGKPSGYTHSTNVGIAEAAGEYIILLNNDVVILGPEWIDLLLQPFDDPRMGITGPLMLRCPDANREFLVFFCAMIRRAMLEEIGTLDEIFSPGYGEDCDLACRAVDNGWVIQQVPPTRPKLADKGCEDLPAWKRNKMWTNDFPIYHDGNKTFGEQPEVYDKVLRRNAQTLKERHGKPIVNIERAKLIDGWFNEDEMEWIGSQVQALPIGAVVVEVGSWKGRSSRAIADNLPEGAKLYCVDTFTGSSGEPDAHATAKDREGDDVFMSFFHNLHDHLDAGRVMPVRMMSIHAAETLNNLRPDLIFIDAAHDHESVKQDIEAWLPLLKEGGLFCGHDYYAEGEGLYWIGVRQAVEEKFPNVEKSATSIWHVRPHEKSRVYDAFIFSTELDLLEIRLATLNDVVDRFVIVEGTMTHAGQPKPLHFENNLDRFAQWLPKITHVVVDDWPELTGSIYDDAWARERHQRDAVMRGLEDCQPNDIIILGDADEIPNPVAITSYNASQGLCRLKQRMFYYYLNCENKEGWDWQKIAPYKMVKELTPCGIRYPPAGDTPLIENGGWHFSFCSSVEGIAEKIKTYSHQEFNTPEITDISRIQSLVESGQDIFGRHLKYEFVEIDDSYPSYIKEHQSELRRKGLIRLMASQGELAREEFHAILDRKTVFNVTACVSTKDRYTTTLGLCISAIATQIHKPDKLLIYDDGEQLDLRELPPFDGLFKMLDEQGIGWEVLRTPRKGQVANHQHALDNVTTDLIWRVDDDEIPMPDCLEKLLACMVDGVGAVAGLLHHPGGVSPLPDYVDGSMHDAQVGIHMQWFNFNSQPREVEHLTSTFLYRVDVGRKVGGYPRNLSTVGHREETIFSHSIRRAGWKLIVTPFAKTYHLRQSNGGIRSFNDTSLWEHDEHVFQSYLAEWGVDGGKPTKMIVIDAGIGDHFAFKATLPKIRAANSDKELVLAVCFPEVFEGDGLKLISIADAQAILGDRYDESSFYKKMWDANWTRSLEEAWVEFYG